MKKLALLMISAMFAASAFAQTPPPAHDPAQHLEKLAILLDLTDAQKQQVGVILDQEHQQMKAMHDQNANGTRPSFEQMRAMHEKMHADLLAKLKPVLDEKQMQKFEILSERPMGGPMHGGRHHHQGQPPADTPAN